MYSWGDPHTKYYCTVGKVAAVAEWIRFDWHEALVNSGSADGGIWVWEGRIYDFYDFTRLWVWVWGNLEVNSVVELELKLAIRVGLGLKRGDGDGDAVW